MNKDKEFLLIALEEARIAYEEGTYPVGAIIVAPSGEIIARGRNRVYSAYDATAHAEIDVIRQAGKKLFEKDLKKQCTLYCTAEPCPMCAGSLIIADIKRVVWIANDNYLGAFRKYKEGPHFKNRFDQIEMTPAPYPDLEEIQRKLSMEWDINRGYTETHWK